MWNLLEPEWRPAGRDALEVFLLGLADLDSVLALQLRLGAELEGCDDRRGMLLICEHPPVITIGRAGSRTHVGLTPGELAARELEVRWTNRGGGAVLHAPGQVAVYPVVPVDRLGLGVAAFRDRLLESVVAACGEQRVTAEVRPEWGAVMGRSGQLAQVGVGVRRGVTRHGLFLNVQISPEWLELVESGLGRQSSLARERQGHVSPGSVREALIRQLAERLGYPAPHVQTGHPWFRRVRREVNCA
ncbi:MAG: lipoyl(octanoyl) transferase LipB [Planctomycetaceae bacterium]